MKNFTSHSTTVKLIIVLFILSFAYAVNAQVVSTVAGGAGGYTDGTVSKVEFNHPNGVVTDRQGNIYVGDRLNNVIRKISAAGVVTTFAGNGIEGYADGVATIAEFDNPQGLAIDKQGNIYVGDSRNERIRKITPSGLVTTIAGNGVQGFADGLSTNAEFNGAIRLAVDTGGNVYVADLQNDRIRKISVYGMVSTVAGDGNAGYKDGNANEAEFNWPDGIAFDTSGNMYISDYYNNRIRKITTIGIVSTVAGNGITGHVDGSALFAEFNGPSGVALDSLGNLFVSDQEGNYIRKISTTGIVSTLTATGVAGFVDGSPDTALLNNPRDIHIDSLGNLYVADFNSNSIRKILHSGYVNTVAGNGLAGYVDGVAGYDGVTTNPELYGPNGVAVDAQGNMYVAEWLGNRIRKITPNGVVTTIAGNGIEGYADGPGATAEFNKLSDIVIDTQGNFFVTEGHGNRIRKITPDGTVSTFAGNGTAGFADGQGTSAEFWNPNRLVFDKQGNLYVADARNNRVRKITTTGLVSTYAGNGIGGSVDGVAANAEFNFPNGLAIDSAGNMFVADYNNNTIREIATNGMVTTVAGDGFAGYNNGTGTNAEFNHPGGICIDQNGDFYISDESNSRIRKMVATGVVSLWAGNGVAGLVDGTADSAEFNDVRALCVDASGNVYVPDYNNNKIRKITTGSALPVTLIKFTAQLSGKDALLQWQTANETNSAFYSVQRSTDGVHFISIGKITASGNSSLQRSYTYTDFAVTNLNAAKLYYRLQEFDKDSRSNYSNIVNLTILLDKLSVYLSPNPVKDIIVLHFSSAVNNAFIKVADMAGKVLYDSKQTIVAGSQLQINTSQWAKGIYIVTVQSEGNKQEFKIVK